jgi:uncharacterized protein (DUF488 family)
VTEPIDNGPGLTIYSVGHGAQPAAAFVAILQGAGVERVVDVRTAPGSRKHPQFGQAALTEALEREGIEYVWRQDLGGWRKARPDSQHVALRSPGFRGYADHMETEEFGRAVSWLINASSEKTTAFMCAETLWWRCHRRMIADALMARGIRVIHLAEGRTEPHRLHPAARLKGERVVYDRVEPEQTTLP